MSLYPPGSDAPYNGTRLLKFTKLDEELERKMTKKSKQTDTKLG